MSTKSTIEYKNQNGQTRTAHLYYDGDLENTYLKLRELHKTQGYQALTNWIEQAADNGYYENIKSTTPTQDNEIRDYIHNNHQYGYEITPDGAYVKYVKYYDNTAPTYINNKFNNHDGKNTQKLLNEIDETLDDAATEIEMERLILGLGLSTEPYTIKEEN